VVITTGSAAAGGQVALGVAIAVCSAALYDVGYVLEKQALAALPPLRLRPIELIRTVVRSRRWLVGFVAMLAGLALQVLALTLAPVTVVQPVLAAGVLALVVVGRLVLGERLGSRDRAAVALVLAAVVAIAISAGSGARLAHAAPAARFAAMTALVTLLAAGAGWFALRGGRRAGGRRDAAALALAAGLLYGIGALAEKAVATRLVGHGLVDGAVSSLGTAYPWVFLVATFGGLMAFQVGLQRQPASLLVPLSNVVSGGCALVGASLVFGELLLPAGWWSLPRWLGFAAVLAAVVVLAAEPEPDPEPEAESRPAPALT
jgi:drug/metabolite transporter (DMT)-like permease